MIEEDRERTKSRKHRFVMALGAVAGVALFAYLTLFQRLIHGRPYGPKWWTNFALGLIVFAIAGGLAAILAYLSVRRERSTSSPR